MNFLTKLRKSISVDWAYRFDVRQTSRYFDTGKGFFFKRNEINFLKQYNQLFNSKEIESNYVKSVTQLRLLNKVNLLRAAYNSLSTESEAEHSKEFFKQTFGKEWEYDLKNYELINRKAEFFINKLRVLQKDSTPKDSISFGELVAIIESSRGIAIDRKMKLIEFHKIYEQE